MRVISTRAALFGTVAAAAFFSTPAFAQTAQQTTEEAQKQPAAQEATTALNPEGTDNEEIIVTSRRIEERLQRVPSSVSAFNERALDRIQAQDTTGLQGAVPNLNIVQGRGSSNATNIYIRGVGQPDALQTFDPAVGVYIDDVYLSRIRGTQLDMLDIERIEVLRGPQGTLYGKNTIGGAFKVVTRKPGQDFRANASVAVGSYDQLEFKATASGPLTKTLSAGISFLRAKRDGFVRDEILHRRYNDKDTVGVRGDIAFTPSDRLRVDIAADYSKDDAALNVGQPLNDLKSLFLLPLPITNYLYEDGYHFKATTTPGFPNSTNLKHRGVSGTIAYDLTDAFTLKSITAFRKLDTRDYIDIDASALEVGDVLVDVDQKQFSEELQLAYDNGRGLTAVGGLYYLAEDVGSHQEAYADDYVRPFLTAFTRFIDDDLKTRSYAGYGNVTVPLVDRVRLSAGLRYTHEKKDYDRSTTTSVNNGPLTPPFVFTPKGSWSDLSPSLTLDYQATPDVMIYGRIAKGFKSGGFNGRANAANAATEYDPETVWSYEAGFKSRIANQLTLNGSVFYNDYKDFQARISAGSGDLGLPDPVLSVVNAGKLNIKGAELEAAWTPIQGLLLDTQIGYLNAEYGQFFDDRFPNDSRAFQTPAFSPKWTVRYGAQYGFDIGSAGSITVGGQWRYRSRTALAVDSTYVLYPTIGSPGIGTTTEVPGLFQPGYSLVDARIVWEDASKRFAVGLYGNNLTNKKYRTDAQEFSSVGEIRTVYYGNPRTVTLRLTARY